MEEPLEIPMFIRNAPKKASAETDSELIAVMRQLVLVLYLCAIALGIMAGAAIMS